VVKNLPPQGEQGEMATIPNVLITPAHQGCLRPFDVRRDLKAVADLVEETFSGTIDPDGKRYLRSMRSAAKNQGFLRWAGTVVETNAVPLSGYVWEEGGKVVGNLSLIPFSHENRRIYLIANVAVASSHRRKGIARTLTAAALDHARNRGARAAWLHVREDNAPAVNLYRSMGFQERARRTTWQNWGSTGLTQESGQDWKELAAKHDLRIGARWFEHWPRQRDWLVRSYPSWLSWYFPFEPASLRPGLLSAAYSLLRGSNLRSWSVQRDGDLLGVLTRQRTSTYADSLWLAVPENPESTAVETLLKFARTQLDLRRPLTIDFPARTAAEPLLAAGYQPYQTLMWMVVPFH
jgi:ribosomal protein S18 acetylase RimI-like enzyme